MPVAMTKQPSWYKQQVVHAIMPELLSILMARKNHPNLSKMHYLGQALPQNLIVDITNFVLMELGQPLHAFDKDKLVGDISVRLAKQGETLVLLNGQSISLTGDELVICDEAGVIALAGIMGGQRTMVDDTTTSIVLESAFLTP